MSNLFYVMKRCGVVFLHAYFYFLHFEVPEIDRTVGSCYPFLKYFHKENSVSHIFFDNFLGIELILVIPEGKASMIDDTPNSLLFLAKGN